jgi:hypothetical protein
LGAFRRSPTHRPVHPAPEVSDWLAFSYCRRTARNRPTRHMRALVNLFRRAATQPTILQRAVDSRGCATRRLFRQTSARNPHRSVPCKLPVHGTGRSLPAKWTSRATIAADGAKRRTRRGRRGPDFTGLLLTAGITTGVLSLPTDPPGRASRGPHPRRPHEYCRVRPRGLTRSD